MGRKKNRNRNRLEFKLTQRQIMRARRNLLPSFEAAEKTSVRRLEI